jgi:uncharacterized membrane protein HdeD (DUF308 family)
MVVGTYPSEYNWWVWAAMGVISILFGLLALFYPGLTLGLLVIFFGVFVLIDGILSLIDMFRAIGQNRTWWPQLIIGIVGILAGLYVLAYPGPAAAILVWVIGFWAIFVGLLEIFTGLAGGQLGLLVIGILTSIFGFILLANPRGGITALIMVIGVFYIARGLAFIVHALRTPEPTAPAAP